VLGPEQRISVMEALRGVTINGAYMQRLEDKIGSREKGKLADLVILDKDPTAVAPEAIKAIKVEETVVGGQTVYRRA
jgi:predicted amidohydrolase YtcJ